MKEIADRVILGPCPRAYPPEPAAVAELAMLVHGLALAVDE